MIASRLIWLYNLRLRLDVLKNSFVTRTTMTDLSPAAAQAVLSAANAFATNAWSDATHQRFRSGVAAALKAAADQVVPEEESCEGGFSDSLEHQCRASERRLARAELLAIAAELEGGGWQ
jgi:hypothetical protein